MNNSENKVLLIVVEGKSDAVTLYKPTKRFINAKNPKVKIEIIYGDIALKENATINTCIDFFKTMIIENETVYHLEPINYLGIYHVIDTDGAFVTKPKSKKFKNKQKIYSYLYSINNIEGIPFKVLFFSRDLEHALYGEKLWTSN